MRNNKQMFIRSVLIDSPMMSLP